SAAVNGPRVTLNPIRCPSAANAGHRTSGNPHRIKQAAAIRDMVSHTRTLRRLKSTSASTSNTATSTTRTPAMADQITISAFGMRGRGAGAKKDEVKKGPSVCATDHKIWHMPVAPRQLGGGILEEWMVFSPIL